MASNIPNKAHEQHLKSYLRRQKGADNIGGKKRTSDVRPTMTIRQSNHKAVSQRTVPQQQRSTSKKVPAMSKLHRWSINDILPNDALCVLFRYLSASDLLRMMCVCKLWMSLITNSDLWRLIFRKLPKDVQALSKIAQTPQEVNWRKECIHCCKISRKQFVQKKLTHKVNGLSTKIAESIRFLDVRWHLVFEDSTGQNYRYESQELYFFTSSLSVRWNELNLPSIRKLRKLSLYALCPVFFIKKKTPCSNSVCTRSLLQQYIFKDGLPYPAKDYEKNEENIFPMMMDNFVFGLWGGQYQDSLDPELAFVTCSQPFHDGLIDKLLFGNSLSPYLPPPHQPYEDDIDPSYGLHGYSGHLSIRNNRSVVWETSYREFYDYECNDDALVISHSREKDYSFYDINKKFEFPWKTAALKGKVQNMCILDFTLMDQNLSPVWCISHPASLKIEENVKDGVTYDFVDGERRTLEVADKDGRILRLYLMMNCKTSMSSVIRTEIQVPKSFINYWFGTSY